MSRERKAGGKVTSLSHPTGSTHPVFVHRKNPFGVKIGMAVASYNDDGSFTGGDGKRYVERLVLIQEDKKHQHSWSAWGFTFEPGDGSYQWQRSCSTCKMGEWTTKDPGK